MGLVLLFAVICWALLMPRRCAARLVRRVRRERLVALSVALNDSPAGEDHATQTDDPKHRQHEAERDEARMRGRWHWRTLRLAQPNLTGQLA
jgi:hypothetical protein